MTLDALFRPRSVAVIGASRQRGSIAGEVFHNLVSQGFSGPVYPVNPSTESVQSVRAYPTLAAIPGDVDLAVLVVPRARVLAAVDECGAKGVKGLVVITAGFAETGAEGKALQDELVRRVRRYGMRMIGPNGLGLLSTATKLNTTFASVWPPSGDVAFSSQSGALGVAILEHARELGLGIHHFVSVGNKADVSGNDLLEYWEKDEGVRVILLYLESLGNPRRFLEIARRVSRVKPILVVKSGRTEAGARAASSHTGSLAGLDVAVDALFGQAGVVRTDTIEELFDLALFLAHQPVPRGDRVAILTNAGGPAIMASDACESRRLVLPSLAPATEAGLRAFLPPEASVRNPVDMIASATPEAYERGIKLLLGDDSVDALIVLFVPPLPEGAGAVADAIRRGAAGASKPVITCFMGFHGIGDDALRAAKIPSYAFPEAAANALARAVQYGRWRERPEGSVALRGPVSPAAAREVVEGGGRERWLTAPEVDAILKAYGIATPASGFATSAAEAAALAARIGFPVAVKLASETLTHKTDVGGVVLAVADEAGVQAAFVAIRTRLGAAGHASEMAGVVIQAMAPRGVETFLGVTQAAAYGPLVGFGLGGVAVEVWKDVVFRVHPLTDVDAREMLDQIRGRALLDGFRGGPVADREALVDALLRVSRLVGDLPEIREMDLNPLVACAPGQGVLAVDARIRIG
jgi:acetyl coenzyme A synthetase (ADP forming)-like protein